MTIAAIPSLLGAGQAELVSPAGEWDDDTVSVIEEVRA